MSRYVWLPVGIDDFHTLPPTTQSTVEPDWDANADAVGGGNPERGVQGYALIEYATLPEARAAIEGAHQTKLLDQTVQVDFAFVRPPPGKGGNRGGAGGGRGGGGPPTRGGGRGGRSRSRSPEGVKDDIS